MRIIFGLISGLCLFLYGLDLIRNGFKRATSENIKKIIDFLTANTFLGVFAGIFITIIMQSSSVTTVLIVGLVNSGLIGLPQALRLIMGANIGTTITPQMISLNLYGIESIPLLIGVLLYIHPTKSKYKYLADMFIGMGLLFTGINLMEYSMEPLIYQPYFKEIIQYISNNSLIGLLVGFSITGIIQNSSASIGMLMALCSNGFLTLSSALPIIYGGNIGSCITSLISSIGTTINAKRAALMHLIFNIIGSFIFIILLNTHLEDLLTKINPFNLSRQIANAHTLFNIINTIILLPLCSFIINLTMKLIPSIENKNIILNDASFLDERILQTPTIALSSTLKELTKFAEKTSLKLSYSLEALLTTDIKKVNQVSVSDKDTKSMQTNIQNYLFNISKISLDEKNRFTTESLLHAINNFKIISNYVDNILNLIRDALSLEYNVINSDINEVEYIYKKTLFTLNSSLVALQNNDSNLAQTVINLQKEIQLQEKYLNKLFIIKLNEGNYDVNIVFLYLSIISNLKNISNHSANIAFQIINSK